MSKYERRARENERKRRRQEWDDLQEQKENEAIDVEDLKQQEDMKQGNYLESKSFEIDPNKKPLTEAQKRQRDKLRRRAGTGQQGSDIAKEKLEKRGGSATDLPTFLQSAEMDEVYSRDKELYGEFDEIMEKARNATGRDRKALLQRAGRIRKRIETGIDPMTIGEVPGAVWGVAQSYAQSMMEDPAAISEHFTDLALDAKAFKKGAAAGAMAGVLVDGPLPFGEAAGAVIGGTGAVVLRRVGKKGIKEIFDWSLNAGRRFFFGDEVVDAATGMRMRINNTDNLTSANPLQMTGSGADDAAQGSLDLTKVTEPVTDVAGSRARTVDRYLKELNLPDDVRFDIQQISDNFSEYKRRAMKAGIVDDRFSWTTFEKMKDKLVPEFLEGLEDLKIDPSKIETHHISGLRVTSALFDGLDAAGRKDLLKILMKEGLFAGNNPGNLMAIHKTPHINVVHTFLEDALGKYGEKIVGDFGSKLKNLPTAESRRQLVKEFSRVIKKSQEIAVKANQTWLDDAFTELSPAAKFDAQRDMLMQMLDNSLLGKETLIEAVEQIGKKTPGQVIKETGLSKRTQKLENKLKKLGKTEGVFENSAQIPLDFDSIR